MGEYIGLEATVKSKKRFPSEPGNWAYFSFSAPDHKSLAMSVKLQATASCNACHLGNAGDDFVFTQYYPVLRAGKGTGKQAIGGVNSNQTWFHQNSPSPATGD